jgi:F-type H+-transporting ATPase subunit gamma
MPSTRDIRRRIRSVKSTAQITKAMQMVASSKMRRAQQAAIAGRPYARLMNRMLAEVTHDLGDFTHPLLEVREAHKTAVILVGTDKGLCGALNSNLLREAARLDEDRTVFITAGRKAAQFIARTRRELAAEFTYKDAPQFSEARNIAKLAREMYMEAKVDRVEVLFTAFVNTLTQRPARVQLLPIKEIKGVTTEVSGEEMNPPLEKGSTEFVFEPGPAQVLEAMLPHYVNFIVYQVLLEAKASEHSARMVAMKSATDNAQGLIKDLTLEYNKIRQTGITTELLEITSAAMG